MRVSHRLLGPSPQAEFAWDIQRRPAIPVFGSARRMSCPAEGAPGHVGPLFCPLPGVSYILFSRTVLDGPLVPRREGTTFQHLELTRRTRRWHNVSQNCLKRLFSAQGPRRSVSPDTGPGKRGRQLRKSQANRSKDSPRAYTDKNTIMNVKGFVNGMEAIKSLSSAASNRRREQAPWQSTCSNSHPDSMTEI